MLKRHLITYLLLTIALLINAQETSRTITGTVSDKSDGELLPGATVMIKGTMKGAVTNLDGAFTYLVQKNNISEAVLVVSYIGYLPQEIILGNKNQLDILLEPSHNSLNEVVITSSYGTKKLKQEVVGSITSVKPQDLIIESAATSLDQLLQGQAAGVNIIASEGTDAPVQINIRGVGTLSSNNGTSTQPLIIIDGVILAEEVSIDGNDLFDDISGAYTEAPSNPLSKLGITDIESINILKDAAAVSLYGADGANGVIIITTKGGHIGKPKLNFSAQSGISTELNPIIYMNGQQYSEMQNEYYANTGQPENIEPWNGVNTDWHDLLNNNGFYQKYNLSMSGGKNNLSYRVSMGIQDTEEPAMNNTLRRYNGNISLGYNKDKLNVSLKMSPSFSERNTPNTLSDYALPPNISAYDDNGAYTHFDSYGNPLAVAEQNIDNTKTKGIMSSINAMYKITPELKVSSLFGINYSDKDTDKFRSGENGSGQKSNGNGDRTLIERKSNKWNWNARAMYDKDFDASNHFDALLGVETRLTGSQQSRYRGTGFNTYDTPQPIDSAAVRDYDDDSSENTGRSLFSQFNYDFQKKYFILANARVDQSSSFGGDNQTSLNGGLGLSWVISKEDFMQNIDWIDFLRLKTSYGTSGNSRIGSYSSLGLYNNFDIDGYNGSYRETTSPSYSYPTTAPNPDLGWEKNKKFNVGIDLQTSNRIDMTLEYFYDNITDMIVSRKAPPETGYSTVQINGAAMYNQGLEFSINSKVIDYDNFVWNVGFNISTIKNKVTYLQGLGSEQSSSTNATAERIGYSTSVIWGYNFKGIDPATGRELYEVDGKVVDSETLKSEYDDASYWEPIGNTQPKVFGGMNNRFQIAKDWTISANLSYQIGGNKLVAKEEVDHYVAMSSMRNMGVNAYYGAWREPGDNATYAAVGTNNLVSNSSKYVYNTSHIKLNNVNLSYRVPLNKTQWIKSLQVTATGSNLAYWFFEKSPEGQNGIKELYRNYSEMSTYTLGVKASF